MLVCRGAGSAARLPGAAALRGAEAEAHAVGVAPTQAAPWAAIWPRIWWSGAPTPSSTPATATTAAPLEGTTLRWADTPHLSLGTSIGRQKSTMWSNCVRLVPYGTCIGRETSEKCGEIVRQDDAEWHAC